MCIYRGVSDQSNSKSYVSRLHDADAFWYWFDFSLFHSLTRFSFCAVLLVCIVVMTPVQIPLSRINPKSVRGFNNNKKKSCSNCTALAQNIYFAVYRLPHFDSCNDKLNAKFQNTLVTKVHTIFSSACIWFCVGKISEIKWNFIIVAPALTCPCRHHNSPEFWSKVRLKSIKYSPIVVIKVIEYKNADAYDHLWVRIGVCTPAVFCIFVDRTARNRVSCKKEGNCENSVSSWMPKQQCPCPRSEVHKW